MNNTIIDLLGTNLDCCETEEAKEHYVCILKQIKNDIQNESIEKLLENIDGLISIYENKCPKCNSEMDYCIVKKENIDDSCEPEKTYVFCSSCNWNNRYRNANNSWNPKFGFIEIKLHPRLNYGFCEICGEDKV